ncbi:MAG: epoxyqueuosine reductase [Desulfuromonadaceae bacterium]|nr:epoxyqueuosine reductase [Desulfuromonadaceae bacterium]
MLKEKIRNEIERFVQASMEEGRFATNWGKPPVAFAAAGDPLFVELKKAVSDSHALPVDLLPGARTVIAYFLPFERSTGHGNLSGFLASRSWAQAYVDTNVLIGKLGSHLEGFLRVRGHGAFAPPATHNFDSHRLISDWSHRHVAFIAGLGRFGVNRMLITEKGCCGRIGSLVTSLPLAPDPRPVGEFCLYRHDGSCLECVKHCRVEALSVEDYDRRKCYGVCLQNEEEYREMGKADVCGKCLTEVPCSWVNPAAHSTRE